MTGRAVANFVVLPKTMGRCGSTWFCDLLDAHPHVACVGEVFNPAGRESFADLLVAWDEGRDARGLFARIAATHRRARCAGLKTFLEQVGEDLLQRLLGVADRLVLIERRNLTAALVSELHAKATATWHARTERVAAAARSAPSIVVDIERGRRRLRHARQNGARIVAMADAIGLSVIELSYEDLVAAPEQTMARVFAALGVEPRPVRSRYRKIHSSAAFVANIDEVNRELGPEFGML